MKLWHIAVIAVVLYLAWTRIVRPRLLARASSSSLPQTPGLAPTTVGNLPAATAAPDAIAAAQRAQLQGGSSM